MYQRDNVAFSIFVAIKSEIQESENSCESGGTLPRIPDKLQLQKSDKVKLRMQSSNLVLVFASCNKSTPGSLISVLGSSLLRSGTVHWKELGQSESRSVLFY